MAISGHEHFEPKKEFTRDDLKDGYVVELRNGTLLYALRAGKNGTLILTEGLSRDWRYASYWRYDLKSREDDSELDIVKVYGWIEGVEHYRDVGNICGDHRPILWSRIEPKKMTVADGKKSELDAFWDMYQQNGNRTNYSGTFGGECWGKIKEHDMKFAIDKVIFNDPATIVFWCDGTKTVVKAQNGEKFDPEKGLMAAITKKALGNKGNYYNVIEKWVGKYEEPATVYKLVPLTEEDELSIGEWKIRMTYYDQDGNVTGTGVYPRTYLYKTSAIRRAKQLWGDNPTVEWSVHLV